MLVVLVRIQYRHLLDTCQEFLNSIIKFLFFLGEKRLTDLLFYIFCPRSARCVLASAVVDVYKTLHCWLELSPGGCRFLQTGPPGIFLQIIFYSLSLNPFAKWWIKANFLAVT